MSQIPLQRNITEAIPLRRNTKETVPLQKQGPSDPIKPMFTPEEARAISAAEQAKLNSADWINKYKAMAGSVTPRADQLSMQDQILTALKDPVYGQATATGLSSGQNMLNSWIAGINARSRKDESTLANERWIKQMQDADEDRALRRKELEESKKQVVQAPGYSLDAFKEEEIKSNPKSAAALERLNTTHVAKNAEEAARIQNQLRLDKQMLDAAQEAAPMKLTSANPKAIDTESTQGFMNRVGRFLNAVPFYRQLALTGNERALANAQAGMEKAGFKTFSSVSPEYLLKEAQKNIESGNTNTGVQQRKIAQLLGELLKRPGFIARQSPDGSTIVVSGPNQKAITLTPNTIDRYIKEYDLSWE